MNQMYMSLMLVENLEFESTKNKLRRHAKNTHELNNSIVKSFQFTNGLKTMTYRMYKN